ncbi:retinitis pigmentosa 9 protein isoform X3 [Bubalus kerabau]|uniref:retinitis pigmentosa 9 protein isoform X7 n=1 Tax=Bubalus bubalis TaxID=89462 RepID=UPI000DBC511A|nr:retinitis pigmentosa 9 protein isoform X7 [Bubalus bubalis]XP_055446413.1 retinitis pigmentosa 9 protein isoform X3 [Bubalus carabanensis]
MSSRPGRDDAGAGVARRPREPPEQELQRRRELKRRRQDAQQLQQLKHLESLKMRLSQKTVYQMSQAMNMPGNFWPTHQPKDFGCHSGKKSKSCSAHEDPMYDIIRENKRHEKDIRIQQLKQLLEDSTSDDDGSSSSSSEDKEKHKKKKKKEKHKKKKKDKKKKKKRKHKSSKSNESSDSE